MLEYTVDAFLAHYSPFLHDGGLVDAVIQTLALLATDEPEKPLLWNFFKPKPPSG
jgi:hypothetical protein